MRTAGQNSLRRRDVVDKERDIGCCPSEKLARFPIPAGAVIGDVRSLVMPANANAVPRNPVGAAGAAQATKRLMEPKLKREGLPRRLVGGGRRIR